MTPEQIKSIRRKLGLTQPELASILGVNRMAVTQWETGVRNPSRMAINFIRYLLREMEQVEALEQALAPTPMNHAELKSLRDSAGWTQAEFAEKLGITENHYARLERGDPREGEVRPITLTLAKLARVVVKIQISKKGA